jgi:hypothetical protein
MAPLVVAVSNAGGLGMTGAATLAQNLVVDKIAGGASDPLPKHLEGRA